MIKKIKNYRRKKFLKFVSNINSVKKIAIFRNGLIGDTIFITPVITGLRKTFSNSRIDVIVNNNSAEILKHNPFIDNIFKYKYSLNNNIFKQIGIFIKLSFKLYDILIILEANPHYTILSALCWTKYKVGFNNSMDWLLSYSVPRNRNVHQAVAEIEPVKEWTVQKDDIYTSIYTTPLEFEDLKLLLKEANISENDNVVCIHPGCNTVRAYRKWIPARYAELSDRLIFHHNVKVIFTGTDCDTYEIDSIIHSMKNPAISLAGRTNLRMLVNLLNRANLVIAPDTSIIHIANALHIPAVMLIGLSDPKITGPFYIDRYSKFVSANLPCNPCVYKNPRPEQWEICKDLPVVKCMQMLEVDDVYNEIMDILK